jgi:PAS domain S-box-containing protein
LRERYGTEKGFGNQPGELAGVVAVGIPVQNALAEIKDRAASVFLVLFSGALLFYLLLVFIFNRVVVNNLHGVLHVFKEEVEEKSLQDFLPEHEPNQSRDELQELTEAALTMSEHLRRTKQKLKQYAQDLEQKVALRTKALQKSEQLLQEKVEARNKELKSLNRISELTTQALGLREVWFRVLQQVLEIIPAQGAGVYLFQEEESLLELQGQEQAAYLPEAVLAQKGCKEDNSQNDAELRAAICQALSGNLSSLDIQEGFNCLNIPMSCRGRVLGVLSLVGLEKSVVSREQQELLLSVGRQVGIAVQSLKDLQSLVQSKELLQTVFDGITDLLMLLDREGRIKMVNKAYLKRYGVQFRDIQDQPCYEMHSGLTEICPQCPLSEVLQSGLCSSQEIKCATGEIFLVHFYPVLDEAGEVQSVIRYAREVSEQKKMEQKIQQTEKLVALGQLASGVAHEINNPLGIILCYADLLKKQLAELPQGLQDLEVIEKQTINCKHIVTDLLQFARSQKSNKEPAQVNEIIQEVVQMFKHKLKKSNIQLELDLDQDLPETRINAGKIKQVLVNLLMNALHAVNEQGLIQISSGQETGGERLWVAIWDNGEGVQSSIQGRIFDPFFSTKVTGEGTGLGLSVSYGIVQEHNGEIRVESEKGLWSRFTVVLPLIQGLKERAEHV